MNVQDELINLRLSIGYLGEKSNFNWWNSEFMSSASNSFLSPVFNRTTELAKYNGVKEAAALKHDEYIGVGKVYHLFRLPEMVEQQLHEKVLREKKQVSFKDQKSAHDLLQNLSGENSKKGEGPVYLGGVDLLNEDHTVRELASIYLNAFEANHKVFPYFKELDE